MSCDLKVSFQKFRTKLKYVIKVQQTQQLMNIPEHKNFYRPLYAVTAPLDLKHYENYMVHQSIYPSSKL